MTALTPLGQQRADTVCVHQAARALRAGCRPEQVVAFLAAYVGLPLPERKDAWADYAHQRVEVMRFIAPEPRRRWWSR